MSLTKSRSANGHFGVGMRSRHFNPLQAWTFICQTAEPPGWIAMDIEKKTTPTSNIWILICFQHTTWNTNKIKQHLYSSSRIIWKITYLFWVNKSVNRKHHHFPPSPSVFSTTRNQPPDADTSRPHHVVSTRCFVSRSVGSRLNVAIEDTRSDGDRMEGEGWRITLTCFFASFFAWRVTEGYIAVDILVHIPFIEGSLNRNFRQYGELKSSSRVAKSVDKRCNSVKVKWKKIHPR